MLEVGNTVDIESATYANTIGASELDALWIDRHFDPEQQAFYYARVLEIPTPRWTTYDAAAFEIPPPDNVPKTVQQTSLFFACLVRTSSGSRWLGLPRLACAVESFHSFRAA